MSLSMLNRGWTYGQLDMLEDTNVCEALWLKALKPPELWNAFSLGKGSQLSFLEDTQAALRRGLCGEKWIHLPNISFNLPGIYVRLLPVLVRPSGGWDHSYHGMLWNHVWPVLPSFSQNSGPINLWDNKCLLCLLSHYIVELSAMQQ